MHLANDKRVHDKECKTLLEAGFKITHICRSQNSNNFPDEHYSDGIKIINFEPKDGIIGRIKNLKNIFLIAVNQDADVYHCNEVDSWFIGVLLKILYKKKCVFDVHEHYPSVFSQSRFPSYLQPTVTFFIHLIFLILVPFTDRLILAKKSVSKDFICKGSKKVLVRNFVPLSSIPKFSYQKPKKTDSSFTIVHLGLFSKVRGWPQVLNALSLTNRNVKLKIIGVLNDDSESEFWNTVRHYRLKDRVSLHSWMPFKEAFVHLQQADVGLIAFQPHLRNHIFAMPHKLFDYMGAGLSVIIPKQAIEVAPIVDEEKCGLLVNPSNPREIADSINSLYDNPRESYQMGMRGYDAVMSKYNWESEASRLISVYKNFS